jgi:ribosomal protein S18 acetylase RimI-like enzyme
MSREYELEKDIQIRTATLDDVPIIRKMHADSWVDTYPNKDAGISKDWIMSLTSGWLTPEKLDGSKEHFKSVFSNSDQYYRVAAKGQNIIGIVHASKIEGAQHIEAIYIDKDHQGVGIAQQMMDNAMGWLDLEKPVTLEVASYNERAKAFYRKYGFEVDKKSEHVFADLIPTVDMTRKGDKK